MGFLYPLFLIAGISLVIPLLIHLFNLRRYKKMDFPSLRFLRVHTVQNKKMSRTRRKLLLLARLLCLAFVVLAFAQPVWKNSKSASGGRHAWVVYIDNSLSMTMQQGQQRLIDLAKQSAIDWISAQQDGAEFVLLTNEDLNNTRLYTRSEIIQAIQKIDQSAVVVTADAFIQALAGIKEQLFLNGLSCVVFSDMQRNAWAEGNELKVEDGIELLMYAVSFEQGTIHNVYVDTVLLLEQAYDPSVPVPVVTDLRSTGGKHQIDFQLIVDGTPQTSRVIVFEETDMVLSDTSMIHLSSGKWSTIEARFQSTTLSFDDEYYLTTTIPVHDNVIVFNEGVSNPYLTSAFAARRGVLPLQRAVGIPLNLPSAQMSLIAFQGLTKISPELGKEIRKLLEEGNSILTCFGKGASPSALNAGLQEIGALRVTGIDTQMQQVVDLQVAHPLIRDVLQSTSDNIQLPYSRYGYKIKAGITAGGQDLLRFRDGAPFISQYQIGSGKLYIIATPLDISAGNLPTSYLFAPVIHKMTVNGGESHEYAIEAGQSEPIFIPSSGNRSQADVISLQKGDYRFVPRQQAKGMGTQVFIPEDIAQAGFYQVHNPLGEDVVVGINFSRKESAIAPAHQDEINKKFGGKNIRYFNSAAQLAAYGKAEGGVSLWKIALVIALCMFAFETWLLNTSNKRLGKQQKEVAK